MISPGSAFGDGKHGVFLEGPTFPFSSPPLPSPPLPPLPPQMPPRSKRRGGQISHRAELVVPAGGTLKDTKYSILLEGRASPLHSPDLLPHEQYPVEAIGATPS